MRKQTIGVIAATTVLAVGTAGVANAATGHTPETYTAVNDQIAAYTDSNNCQSLAGHFEGDSNNKATAFEAASQNYAQDIYIQWMNQQPLDEQTFPRTQKLLQCLNLGYAGAYFAAINATEQVRTEKAKTYQATRQAEANKAAATKNAAELAKQFRYKYQTGNRLQRLCEKKAVKKSKNSRKLCKQMADRLGKPTKIYSVNSQGRLVAKSVIR